jgi:ubiquinone biosynthesis protein
MFSALRNAGHLMRVARILARHDALFPLEIFGVAPAVVTLAKLISRRNADGRPGQRLARALNEAGPSFIKMGQALATRSDLLGEELAADLSELQDSLPPFSSAQARATIEAEFDDGMDALFTEFDDQPVAAASIAQVHFAVTSDGDEVAVKVLRPGVEAAFAADLDLMAWLAAEAEKRLPEIRRLKPVESVRIFADAVAMEMDLRLEAAAGEELAANFSDDAVFRVPAMDWARTGRRVLTLQRIATTPIDEAETLREAGFEPDEIVAQMARIFFLQVFRDGFFHGDLHPGNLSVAADGTIWAVDFGIMGRIDKATRHYLAEMLSGFLNGDYLGVADVHIRAGYVSAHHGREAFAQAARAIAEPIFGLPMRDISLARLLAQLFEVTRRFEMETQPQLLLLQKTMLVAEGVGRQLSPDTNMWELARPLIEDWVAKNMTAEARAAEAVGEGRGEAAPRFRPRAGGRRPPARALAALGRGGGRRPAVAGCAVGGPDDAADRPAGRAVRGGDIWRGPRGPAGRGGARGDQRGVCREHRRRVPRPELPDAGRFPGRRIAAGRTDAAGHRDLSPARL